MRQQTTTAGIIAEAIISLQFRPSGIPWSGTCLINQPSAIEWHVHHHHKTSSFISSTVEGILKKGEGPGWGPGAHHVQHSVTPVYEIM
jgi:hypothetical protein